MKKPKRTPRAQAQPAPAVETPLSLPEVWTVTTCMKDRTPKVSTASPVNTSVNELKFGASVVMVLEGPTGYDSLRDLARRYNAQGVDLKTHHKAFADLPAGTRATLSAKLPETFQGFEDPSTPPRKTLKPASSHEAPPPAQDRRPKAAKSAHPRTAQRAPRRKIARQNPARRRVKRAA